MCVCSLPFPCCLVSYTPLVSPVATILTYWLLVSNLVAGAYCAKQAGKQAGRTQPGHSSLQGKSRQDENVLIRWTVFHTQPTLRVAAGRSSRGSLAGVCLVMFRGFRPFPDSSRKCCSSAPSLSLGEEPCTFSGLPLKTLWRDSRTAVCPAVGHVLPCFSCLCPSPQPLTHKHCLVGLAQSAGLRRV